MEFYSKDFIIFVSFSSSPIIKVLVRSTTIPVLLPHFNLVGSKKAKEKETITLSRIEPATFKKHPLVSG